MFVSVCVRETRREKERERKGETEKNRNVHKHVVILLTLLSRVTYSEYRDIPPEASKVKCQRHVIWHVWESNQQPSDYQPDSLTVQPQRERDRQGERG